MYCNWATTRRRTRGSSAQNQDARAFLETLDGREPQPESKEVAQLAALVRELEGGGWQSRRG
jgi:hypothetical protein